MPDPRDAYDPRPMVALAEDDEVHAALLGAWLEEHGFRVAAFPSGDALLGWVGTGGAPGAFLLDIGTPGSDGIDTCRALRALPGHARTPVLFVTALPVESVSGRALAAGGTVVLPKDVHLLPRLTFWLGLRLQVA